MLFQIKNFDFKYQKFFENGADKLQKQKKPVSTEKIAFLTALSLFFSYFETILPKFTPFLKLGLSNTIVISAFHFDFSSFLVLLCSKTVITSLFGGTLLSPFFLISICQSFTSGILMYFLNKLNSLPKKRFFSVYGISIFGAAASSCVQILLSSLYLGKGMIALLAPMLIFSIFSGFVTAFLSEFLKILQNIDLLPDKIHRLQADRELQKTQITGKKKTKIFKKSKLLIILFVMLSLSAFFIKNIFILCVFLVFAFLFQIVMGKKIRILPHLFLWIFVIFSAILVPNGEVLFKIGNFAITKGSLFTGLTKSLRLSVTASLSLSLCSIDFESKTTAFFAKVMEYFRFLMQIFNESEGNIFQKVKKTLSV